MTISVACIGASAEGMESLKLLLAHFPAIIGLAFVFIQHFDPKRHDNLSETLPRVKAMPVRFSQPGDRAKPCMFHTAGRWAGDRKPGAENDFWRSDNLGCEHAD
jgi:chemotaxis response regulator CheB